MPLAIFLKKMKTFGDFFLKKCQVFGNFLAVKWQFSGGSGHDLALLNIVTSRSEIVVRGVQLSAQASGIAGTTGSNRGQIYVRS